MKFTIEIDITLTKPWQKTMDAFSVEKDGYDAHAGGLRIGLTNFLLKTCQGVQEVNGIMVRRVPYFGYRPEDG